MHRHLTKRNFALSKYKDSTGRKLPMYLLAAENPLFLAKDVAGWIEHSNPRMMLQKIDEDEKVTNNVCTLGGVQKALFLTEDWLYEVLIQSRKPIAKQFKKEVKNTLTISYSGNITTNHLFLTEDGLWTKKKSWYPYCV